MLVFVDTNVWLAASSASDGDHSKAVERFGALAGRAAFVTSDYVLDETLTLVKRRVGARGAVRLGERIRDSSLVRLEPVQPGDLESAWALFVKHADQPLSFTDCTIVAQVRRLNAAALFTFDRAFAPLGLPVIP